MIRKAPPAQVAEGQDHFGTSRSRMQQQNAGSTRARYGYRFGAIVQAAIGCCILLLHTGAQDGLQHKLVVFFLSSTTATYFTLLVPVCVCVCVCVCA